ncbi:unnamed protein product [Cuscuta europaea]|uniref:Uncharacterized protein n=1 Tax=Cuscuta europaea TaxID=41803 RepID=A0A9P0ZDB4_CUSEU|nr:unnamed protein product [Cuscuta europaea]
MRKTTPKRGNRAVGKQEKRTQASTKQATTESHVITVDGVEYVKITEYDNFVLEKSMKINSYCNPVKAMESIRSYLTEDELKEFRKSVYGYLLDLGNIPWVNGQLLILLYTNHVERLNTGKGNTKLEFFIGNNVACFTKQDMSLIIGFPFGTQKEITCIQAPMELWRRYFFGMNIVA